MAVGVLGRPHGIGGELALRSYDDRGRGLAGVRKVLLVRAGRLEPHEVLACRPVGGGYLVRLAGVANREAAALLTLSEVRVARAELPPLAPGEYYVEDVSGCAVEDEQGAPLGTVVGTFWNGAHDVVTVVDAAGTERLIPLVPDVVLFVDAPGRKLAVRWDTDL